MTSSMLIEIYSLLFFAFFCPQTNYTCSKKNNYCRFRHNSAINYESCTIQGYVSMLYIFTIYHNHLIVLHTDNTLAIEQVRPSCCAWRNSGQAVERLRLWIRCLPPQTSVLRGNPKEA